MLRMKNRLEIRRLKEKKQSSNTKKLYPKQRNGSQKYFNLSSAAKTECKRKLSFKSFIII